MEAGAQVVTVHPHPKAMEDDVIRCIVWIMGRFGCDKPEVFMSGKQLEGEVLRESERAVFHAFNRACEFGLIHQAPPPATNPDRPGPDRWTLSQVGVATYRALVSLGAWRIPTKRAKVLEPGAEPTNAAEAGLAKINAKEMPILKLLVAGVRDEEIAAELKTSVSSVRKHITAMAKRLKLENRNLLLVWGARAGL
jgi:DNA-binding CsgD family transcriptional regulator